MRLLRLTGRLLASAALLLVAAWGCGALWFQAPGGMVIKTGAMSLWCLGGLAMLYFVWQRSAPASRRRRAWLAYAMLLIVMAGWWHGLQPSNERDWADDVAQRLHGSVAGDIVTLHNVRNFTWRSETDYTPRWETRQYDLAQLDSIDMVLSYWDSPAIAHTLVSFGFKDGSHIVFSVEIRKERHEQFSELGGFFKQFELSLIAADERDIIQVRTAARGEQVYLYPIRMPQAEMRALFLAYVQQANELDQTPRFYHTVWTNCTTLVYRMVRAIVPGLPLDYRILVSGYLPEYLDEQEAFDSDLPLPALKQAAFISERAAAVGDTPAFSTAIRAPVAAP